MSQEDVVPVHHSVLSATATTMVESGKSGVGGAVKGGLITGGIALALTATGIVASIMFLGPVVGLLGVLGSLAVGIPTSLWLGGFGGMLGGLIGLGKGAVHGSRRVSQENGAAAELSAQIAAIKAGAPQTAVYASGAPESDFRPVQNANAAESTRIQADTVARAGVLTGEQAMSRA